ncbi:MAG: DUF445 domain-containing protein, partial [Anaerolineae bacterium]
MDYLIQEDPRKAVELKRMKFLATGLLAAAFGVFVVASMFEPRHAWVGFIRATAEAAMVGALADWFAVTALFRHPLGLKIPHTAIIPKNKDLIGHNLGRFIRVNFLSRAVISDKLHSMALTRRAAEWLIQPQNSRRIANQVALGVAAVVQVMKDEDIQELIEQNLAARLRATPLTPLAGNALAFILSGGRQQELLYGAIKLAARLLAENREAIQLKIGQETPWWLPKTVDRAIYQKIVDAVDETLQQVSADPNHPLHAQFEAVVTRLVQDLKQSPQLIAREEALKEELLQHAVVRQFSASLWRDIKTSLIERSDNPNVPVHQSVQEGLIRLGETILSDEALLEKVNRWVEESALYFVGKYGYELEHLIWHTISSWDTEA